MKNPPDIHLYFNEYLNPTYGLMPIVGPQTCEASK
jgi:hypothetical protein